MARQTKSKRHYKPGRGPETPVEPGVIRIRGFARGCLIDPDGTEHMGDWHENAITTKGVEQIMHCFVASAGSLPGIYMGVGNHTNTIASTASAFNSTEFVALTGAASTARATASVASAAYGTLSFTRAFASSDISTDTVAINAVGIFGQISKSTGSAYSIATFAQSTKSTSQALNVTYVWNFAT